MHGALTRARRRRCLGLLAASPFLCFGVMAQDAAAFLSIDSANRSGAMEMTKKIAKLIAERSPSPLVHDRARPNGKWGRVEPTVEELLADIGPGLPTD